MRTVDDKGRTLEQFLAEYRPGNYPRPSLTVDTLLFCGRKILLIRRRNHPYIDCWALPGGFVNPDESCGQAAVRELQEETGLSVPVRQLLTLSRPDRDPRTRVVSVAYEATVPCASPTAGDDAREAEFFMLSGVKKADSVVLTLTGRSTLTASVRFIRTADGKIDVDTAACEGDLAFDHAAVIAFAMEEKQWI